MHHPDNGGDLETMKEINAEYDRLFKLLKDRHENCKSSTDSSTESNYNNMKYDFAEDEKLREILNKIIHFEGIDIVLVCAWIGLSGNTYQCRNQLKELGFKFAPKKKMWYWHSDAFRKMSRKTLSMDDIRSYYGCAKVEPERRMALQQA